MKTTDAVPRVLVIYGNPKRGGFVHGCLDLVADALETDGVAVERLHLLDRRMEYCSGCFHCLRTGTCPQQDDVASIIDAMRRADGFVTGASVRNSFFPAIYKNLIERTVYHLAFTFDLTGKPVLAIGSVGMTSGKKNLRAALTLKGYHLHESDYLFFRTGIPTKITPEDARARLERGLERFRRDLAHAPLLSPGEKLAAWIDRQVIGRFMLKKDQDGVYANVSREWKEKGLI